MMNFKRLISPLKVTSLTSSVGDEMRKIFSYHFGCDNV